MSKSQICDFYEGQKVFITGGTGFMGKVLIEKLLRSTNVKTIYILIRSKKGKDISERLNEIWDTKIFETLKNQNPECLNRVTAIAGDIDTPNLGLSSMDSEELILNVNIVFHLAATIRFNDKLKEAYNINVNGTRSILMLSKQMEHLKSLVHVSTAFVDCNVTFLDEVFSTSVDYETIDSFMKTMSKTEIDKLQESILQTWSNTTYIFTKTLAELLIKNNAEDLPIGIFRPPIVSSTYKEPIEGWTEQFGGAVVITIAAAVSLLRIFLCNPNQFVELVPADMAIAALMACAWDVNKNAKRTNDIPIYNYISSVDNPLTWQEYKEQAELQYLDHYPLSNSTPIFKVLFTTNLFVFRFLSLIFHYFPAFVMDLKMLISFKRPRIISKYRKLDEFILTIQCATIKKRSYTNKNVQRMWSEMNEKDRQLFPFNMALLHWLHFFRNYFKGLRLYLLKDPLTTLPSAKLRKKRILTAFYFTVLFFCFMGMYMFLEILSSTFSKWWKN